MKVFSRADLKKSSLKSALKNQKSRSSEQNNSAARSACQQQIQYNNNKYLLTLSLLCLFFRLLCFVIKHHNNTDTGMATTGYKSESQSRIAWKRFEVSLHTAKMSITFLTVDLLL